MAGLDLRSEARPWDGENDPARWSRLLLELYREFVLNPAAWSNPANGVFGTSARFYNDYRYQRRPDEELSLARLFRIREHMSFMIRGEFFNVFNRTYMNNPTSGNAQATPTRNASGVPVSGFGMINTGSVNNFPRHGQIVARFQW